MEDNVRVFTLGGVEILNFSIPSTGLCLCSFKNLVGVVLEKGDVFKGRQNIGMMVMDVSTKRLISDFPVSLSPNSFL